MKSRISSESLEELRQKLPKGYTKEIRARLLKKNINYTGQYISQCMNPNRRNYNSFIIHEAILLGEEFTASIKELEERVSNLRKVS
jgi:hypothetical protein